jgi:hypothetical protein
MRERKAKDDVAGAQARLAAAQAEVQLLSHPPPRAGNYPPPCQRGKSLNLWVYGQR